MSNSKADVILHPVRMKIIQSLAKRSLNVQELLEWLPEIPQATLYRQLKVLTESGVIYISDERKVRGTFERSYSLNNELVQISKEEINSFTKEEHLKYFITYTANLIKGVEEYLDSDHLDMEKDGFGYRQVDLFLDDSEFDNFRKEFVTLLNKYSKNEPNGKRKRRTMAAVFIPEKPKN